MFLRAWLFLLLLPFLACQRPTPAISFYYWKTTYQVSAADQQVLAANQVQDLYLRYFDLDWPPGAKEVSMLAPVKFGQTPDSNLHIIPVVFIKNRVFLQTPDSLLVVLAEHVAAGIQSISETAGIHYREIQVDCDWTRRTRDNYFKFLTSLKTKAAVPLSATIRLHQVKYPVQSGIPPVSRGLLMYYNMGYIADVPENSIYDEKNAAKYAAAIPDYPLPMDLALPIFSWGIQIRNGKVLHLLNKMNEADFAQDSMFEKTATNRYKAKQAGFKSGYYFQENDLVKIEQVSSSNLKEIAAGIRANKQYPFQQLIFYDFDARNYNRYEKTIFKDIAAALH